MMAEVKLHLDNRQRKYMMAEVKLHLDDGR
jgi:hypothetical protein